MDLFNPIDILVTFIQNTVCFCEWPRIFLGITFLHGDE